MDPRLAGIERRLAEVRRVIAVTGGKGGIGKSSVASILALVLAERGLRVGLLDLDVTAPTDHIILGADDSVPTEEFGLQPPQVHGIRFMSVSQFLGHEPAPLRGTDVTNVILELLAVTCWGTLDVLVIDMPPGLGDASLDVVRLLRRAEYLVVAGRSRVVVETVRRMLHFLSDLRVPICGVVENMAREPGAVVEALARQYAVPYLGALPFDPHLEDAHGRAAHIGRTAIAVALRGMRDQLFPHSAGGQHPAP
ncbi:MAG: ATP-binding protein [Deltaproteobacteria bacterium]|jgi:ATP-binding protein involved in chromosome partitioning|nr:ATP-binding protein [Deltaproteobacteria bacterium]